jgi:hypothetical protein
MPKEGILYFHQGWTDIINCLALINYYGKLYDNIYLIMREDAKPMLDFYTKDIKNLQIFYENKLTIDSTNGFEHVINKYSRLQLQEAELLGIGCHDMHRKDDFKRAFFRTSNFFINRFYESYNISFNTRITDFNFTRNKELENSTYEQFINRHGNEYILYHEIIENYDRSKKIVNLNGISDIFFDTIKVLENALEIHLLDSVWAAFIYQLDAKYNLFQNKKIVLYAKRGYRKMFEEPIKLTNWIMAI